MIDKYEDMYDDFMKDYEENEVNHEIDLLEKKLIWELKLEKYDSIWLVFAIISLILFALSIIKFLQNG